MPSPDAAALPTVLSNRRGGACRLGPIDAGSNVNNGGLFVRCSALLRLDRLCGALWGTDVVTPRRRGGVVCFENCPCQSGLSAPPDCACVTPLLAFVLPSRR